MTHRNVASSKKAVNASQASRGPAMLPAVRMKPGQLVPNCKLIVMPLTTPSAKVSANTLTLTR